MLHVTAIDRVSEQNKAAPIAVQFSYPKDRFTILIRFLE